MVERAAHVRARHRRTDDARVRWALALGGCALVSIPVGLAIWTPSAAQQPADSGALTASSKPEQQIDDLVADTTSRLLPTSRSTATPPPRPAKAPTLPHMGAWRSAAGADTISVATSAAPLIAQAQLLALVRAAFPADQVTNAMAVADCESGQQSIIGQQNNDGSTDWGIFQLNDAGTLQSALSSIGQPTSTLAAAQAAALDPLTNVTAAARIYADRGWAPWVCAYKKGIVAALWSNTPGPLAGKYSIDGTTTFDLTPDALPTPEQTTSPDAPIPSRPTGTPTTPSMTPSARQPKPTTSTRPTGGVGTPAPGASGTPKVTPRPSLSPTPTATATGASRIAEPSRPRSS